MIDHGCGRYMFDLAEIRYPFPLIRGQEIQLDGGDWVMIMETLAVSSEDDLRRRVLEWQRG